MTRQEEYYEEASKYAKTHHSKADNDFQTAMNIAVQKAFVAAAEWKDAQPQIIEIFGRRVKIVEDTKGTDICEMCAFCSKCDHINVGSLCEDSNFNCVRHFVEVDEDGNEIGGDK